jgi:hypothetical protein
MKIEGPNLLLEISGIQGPVTSRRVTPALSLYDNFLALRGQSAGIKITLLMDSLLNLACITYAISSILPRA